MSDIRDSFLLLQHALNMLIKNCDNFLLTIEINTVAIITDNKGHYRLFDSHSRDFHGDNAVNGTAILLEFNTVHETVQYLKNVLQKKECSPI